MTNNTKSKAEVEWDEFVKEQTQYPYKVGYVLQKARANVTKIPEVAELIEAAEETLRVYTCPACSIDDPGEDVPCECDTFFRIRLENDERLRKALSKLKEGSND